MIKLDKVNFKNSVGAPGGAGKVQAFFSRPEYEIELEEDGGYVRIRKGKLEVLTSVTNMLEATPVPKDEPKPAAKKLQPGVDS